MAKRTENKLNLNLDQLVKELDTNTQEVSDKEMDTNTQEVSDKGIDKEIEQFEELFWKLYNGIRESGITIPVKPRMVDYLEDEEGYITAIMEYKGKEKEYKEVLKKNSENAIKRILNGFLSDIIQDNGIQGIVITREHPLKYIQTVIPQVIEEHKGKGSAAKVLLVRKSTKDHISDRGIIPSWVMDYLNSKGDNFKGDKSSIIKHLFETYKEEFIKPE